MPIEDPTYTPPSDEEAREDEAQEEYESAQSSASDNPLDQDTRSGKGRIDHILSKNLPTSPLSGKRDIVLRCYNTTSYGDERSQSGLQWFNVIQCKTKPSNGSSWDEAVLLEDVTGDALAALAIFSSFGFNKISLGWWYQQYFPLTLAGGGSLPWAVTRSIKVTFASGHTEIFEILFPLTHILHLHQWSGTPGSGTFTFDIKDCNPGQNGFYDSYWDDHTKKNGISPVNPMHYITKWNPVDDPLGIQQPYEHMLTGYATAPTWFTTPTTSLATAPHGPGTQFGKNGMAVRGTTTARQEFHSIDIIIQDGSLDGIASNAVNGSDVNTIANAMSSSYGSLHKNHNGDSTPATNFASLKAWLQSHKGPTFAYRVYYAENLTDCMRPTRTTYYVCDDPGNPSYWQTTWLGSLTQGQCNNITIPVADRPGGSNHINCTFVHDDACCFACTLILQASTTNSAFATNTGRVTWDVADPAGSFTASGTPFSTQVYAGTADSMYTVSVTASTGAVLAQNNNAVYTGGVTFTVASGATTGTNTVTCASNDSVHPGCKVSGTNIPAGSYVGQIVTGTIGTDVTAFNIVDATGSSIVTTGTSSGITLSFGTGIIGTWGSLMPNDAAGLGAGTWYILCVSDDDDCRTCTTFTIDRNAAPTGCTDNTACNYDAAAVIDDGSCFLCNAGTGELTDPGNGFQGQLFDNTVCTPVETSTHLVSDGIITASASMQNSATFACSFDADETYTMTLYDCVTAGSMTGATVNTTTSGIATTTYGASPSNTWSSLAHGYYAIKVQFVDSGTAHCLENCYTIFYCTVQARVCDDVLADNYVTTGTVPGPLRFIDNTLCTYTVTCCQLSSLQFSAVGTTCSPVLETQIDCDPTALTVSGYWTFNGIQVAGSAFTLGSVSGSGPTIYSNANVPVFTASGTYGVTINVTYASASPCTQTIDGYFAYPIYGCMDPLASNWNPAAVCPDGSCIYPSWNCLPPCNCIDPGNGTGTYSDFAACQAACPCIVYGCMDPCATNFDPLATDPDGSCTYKICQDQTALNYQYSCDCGMQMPNATLTDPGCCIYCINPVVTNLTIYPATQVTGTCATSNDGGFSFTFYSPQCGTVGYDVYNAAGVLVGGSSFINGGPCFAANAIIQLAVSESSVHSAGNYNIIVYDCCNNCQDDWWITVPGTIDICGCTDPTADNYDPAATIDDGTCLYCGCMDPTATNYDPNAVCDDGSCSWVIEPNPCIPEKFSDVLRVIDLCLSEQGTDWLLKYKIGTNTDCITLNKWKLILIRYLANLYGDTDGLDCLFNCADTDSIDQEELKTCEDLWNTGGPVTGANDQGYAGSTQLTPTSGTFISDPALYFVQGNTLHAGDIIKMPSGLIWRVAASAVNCTFGCYNPETNQGAQSAHWIQCLDSMRTTPQIPSNGNGGQTYTTLRAPYWDNFINFVNKYCTNCKISLLDKTKFTQGVNGVDDNASSRY